MPYRDDDALAERRTREEDEARLHAVFYSAQRARRVRGASTFGIVAVVVAALLCTAPSFVVAHAAATPPPVFTNADRDEASADDRHLCVALAMARYKRLSKRKPTKTMDAPKPDLEKLVDACLDDPRAAVAEYTGAARRSIR